MVRRLRTADEGSQTNGQGCTSRVALLIGLLVACCGGAAEPAGQSSTEMFRFAGGERVRLIVPKEVGESVEQLVTDDGCISLPGGGPPLNIKGKTLTEAHALINEQLEKQSGAKRAYAALAIMELPPRRIYVGGEVKLPQAITLPTGGKLALAAALASAGGATPEGDISKISVVQKGPTGALETTSHDASKFGAGKTGPVLEPGALVNVPRGEVFVLAGEVAKPGAFSRRELSIGPGEPARLTRVLFGGGGCKPTANRKDVRVVRTDGNGARQVIPVDLDAAIRATEKGADTPSDQQPAPEATKTGSAAEAKDPDQPDPDIVLQNGDIVLVGPGGGVTILGRVKQPGVYPLGGDTLKLSRLVALAGGFSDFAKTSAVTVTRAAAPKKPVRVDMSSITKEGDLEKDLDLEDGDLVFVSERLL